MGDGKNYLIVVLILIIVALGVYIGISKYNQKQAALQQAIYEKGLQDGQLYEQRNVIMQLQSQGFYSLSFLDEQNETQTIYLSLIQQPGQQSSGIGEDSSGMIGR